MKRMIRMIVLIPATLVAGCSLGGDPPVTVSPANNAICLAMGPAFPLAEVSYNTHMDTPATVAIAKKHNLEYRAANARYQAACK